jgi:hypothetical protein
MDYKPAEQGHICVAFLGHDNNLLYWLFIVIQSTCEKDEWFTRASVAHKAHDSTPVEANILGFNSSMLSVTDDVLIDNKVSTLYSVIKKTRYL